MKRIFATLVVTAMLSSPAIGCWNEERGSVVFEVKPLTDKVNDLCGEIAGSIDNLVEKFQNATAKLTPSNPLSTDYWDEWVIESAAPAAMYTQHVEGSIIGLGLWMPEELAEDEELSYIDYLENQGLQLSIGLGEKNDVDPRMRVDYKWHDDYESSVTLQFEFPID